MGTENSYVLAMYDVGGKQEYIFRSQKIKEIVGGSLVIKDIFKDYLLGNGDLDKGKSDEEKFKIYNYLEEKDNNKKDFSVEGFKTHIRNGYAGEVIYDGGGKCLLLFKDKETFEKVTHDFTYRVLKATGTLRVIGTCIEGVCFNNFPDDKKRLYEDNRITDNMIRNVPLYGSLPIVMTDYNSSMPIIDRREIVKNEDKKEVTHEMDIKYTKYENERNKKKEAENEIILDKIAPEKGRDSHIAIVYIDGNNMGAKFDEATGNDKSYEACIKALRMVSEEIQNEFIEDKKQVIDDVIRERNQDDENNDKNKKGKRRVIIEAGDEINLICAAKDALDVTRAYLKELKIHKEDGIERKYSSCAGIAIFKSHMPYADAYRIAEECCENCKDVMKKEELSDVSLIDFHYCQGAIGVSLKKIREEEETQNVSRPWLVTDISEEIKEKNITDITDMDTVDEMKKFLQGIGHSNVKGLLDAAKESKYRLDMELKRIKAHQSDSVKKEMEDLWKFVEDMDETLRQKLIYDMVLVYDFWFKKKGE